MKSRFSIKKFNDRSLKNYIYKGYLNHISETKLAKDNSFEISKELKNQDEQVQLSIQDQDLVRLSETVRNMRLQQNPALDSLSETVRNMRLQQNPALDSLSETVRNMRLQQNPALDNLSETVRNMRLQQNPALDNLSETVRNMRLQQNPALDNLSETVRNMRLQQDSALDNISEIVRIMKLPQQSYEISKYLKKSNFYLDYKLSTVINELNKPKLFITKPVIDSIDIKNFNDIKYVESKFSDQRYKITNSFNEEKDQLEYVVKNAESNESIPVDEIVSTIAITDIFDSIKIDEVISFYSHLAKFPLLGLNHPVGKRIFDEIIEMKTSTIENVNVFRVRDRNSLTREVPFVESEMFDAPHGIAGHGRFNPLGLGELYVSTSKQIAIKETAKDYEGVKFEVIEWRIEKSLELLNLTLKDSPLSMYCSFRKQTSNAQEYLIPNFIAQCAKYHKITGIIYNSVHDKSSVNYVLFNFDKNWFNNINLEVDKEYSELPDL